MTTNELLTAAETLERKILSVTEDGRLGFHTEYQDILRRIRAGGASVPQRLRRLEQNLAEQAAEQMFDNMPI
ncbi:hypothetical protein [Epibacterium ulvae]|uniref:Uncharacterized protein n=1 Tax=Epibacterium ulvae TaxID=1156985 RepID=A0A1G5Q177_9RHOB|nr:hypothetical protein [Epibacterium ulvae]SCZ55422.1 hypothetical protein SAMN04488118_102416 [Epibacterium ulvae]